MGESWACVTGEIAIASSAQKRWKALIADPASYSDWPKPAALPDDASKVSQLLRDLEQSKRFGALFFLEENAKRVSVRARFTSESDYWCQTLALAFRAAVSLGATGRITIIDATEPPVQPPLEGGVWVLDLDGRSSRYRALRGTEKSKANADPALFALLSSFDNEKRTITPRRAALVERMERANVKRQAAADKRGTLSPSQARSALLKRVAKQLTTSIAIGAAEQLMANVLTEPDAAETLWQVWKLLRARAPKRGTGAYTLDQEKFFLVRVGKALIQIERARISDKKLRALLTAATRKEWPDPKQFSGAMDALARAVGSAQRKERPAHHG